MALKSDPQEWTDRRHRRGLEGELVALNFLRRRGWEVLDHRFRLGRCEVDIIARQGNLVAFIEVKARWTRGFGSPLEAVTPAKQREIARVARGWIDRNGSPGERYRFDVIGVIFEADTRRLVHVEDAFRAGWR